MHFFVCGLKFQSQLSDVQFKARILFVEPFKLALHLLERKMQSKVKSLLWPMAHNAKELIPFSRQEYVKYC